LIARTGVSAPLRKQFQAIGCVFQALDLVLANLAMVLVEIDDIQQLVIQLYYSLRMPAPFGIVSSSVQSSHVLFLHKLVFLAYFICDCRTLGATTRSRTRIGTLYYKLRTCEAAMLVRKRKSKIQSPHQKPKKIKGGA
jgi:hypothetical protein